MNTNSANHRKFFNLVPKHFLGPILICALFSYVQALALEHNHTEPTTDAACLLCNYGDNTPNVHSSEDEKIADLQWTFAAPIQTYPEPLAKPRANYITRAPPQS